MIISSHSHESSTYYAPELVTSKELLPNLLAIGNHEAKALLYSEMTEDSEYQANQLSELLIDAQGTNPSWKVGKALGRDYCEESLVPSGLVSRVVDTDTRTNIYRKADLGHTLADALSGHLLELSLKYEEFSLYDIFGATHTSALSGKRSPAARLAIFEELLTQVGPVQVKDLRNAHINDWANVSSHLLSLTRAGVIDMSKRTNSDPIVRYKLGSFPLNEMRIRPEISPLTTDLRNVLSSIFEFDPDEFVTPPFLTEQLRKLSPEYAAQSKAGLRGKVSQALNNFTKQNGLVKTNPDDQSLRSQISLSERQESLLTDCMNIIYGFTDDESFVEEGLKKAHTIISDPELVGKLMSKAQAHSPFANNHSDAEKFVSITKVLESREAMTVAEIDEHLNKELGRYTIRAALRALESEARIKRVNVNGKTKWIILKTNMELQS